MDLVEGRKALEFESFQNQRTKRTRNGGTNGFNKSLDQEMLIVILKILKRKIVFILVKNTSSQSISRYVSIVSGKLSITHKLKCKQFLVVQGCKLSFRLFSVVDLE